MHEETLAFPGLSLSTRMQHHATHTPEPALDDSKDNATWPAATFIAAEKKEGRENKEAVYDSSSRQG